MIILRLKVISTLIAIGHAFVMHQRNNVPLVLFSTAVLPSSKDALVTDNALSLSLKKPSKTLAVALEYSCNVNGGNSLGDVSTLSMQLRKLKASALVTNNLDVAAVWVQEQASAQGNFPGPCPVLDSGQDIEGAVKAGVTAVIVSGGSESLSDIRTTGVEVIGTIESPEFVEAAASTTTMNAFLVNGDAENVIDILAAIPSSTNPVIIASLQAMQSDNAEISKAKYLKERGVTCILFKNSCVGDGEDLQYAAFVIEGLTKKKSSTFNMSGLTGSTNGHFGGIATTTAKTWLRTMRNQ